MNFIKSKENKNKVKNPLMIMIKNVLELTRPASN